MLKRVAPRVLVLFSILSVITPVAAQLKVLNAGFSVTARTVTGGSIAVGVVTLSAPAPADGFTLRLASTNTALAIPDSGVTVPAGATAARFGIKTYPVATDTTVAINVTSPTASSFPVTILAPQVASLSFSKPLLPGGTPTVGTIVLNGPAPEGFVVPLAKTTTDNVVTLPASVTFMGELSQRSATFSVTPSTVSSAVTISVTAGSGTTAKTANLTVVPPTVVSITPAGDGSSVVVTMSGPAPASGITIPVTSSNPAVVSIGNAGSCSFGSGQLTKSISMATTAVGTDTPVTLTAGSGADAKSMVITVPGPQYASIDLPVRQPDDSRWALIPGFAVRSGMPFTVGATAASVASAGFQVNIISSRPDILTIPPFVISQGKTAGSVSPVLAKLVAEPTPVTLTAGQGSSARTNQLTVLPPESLYSFLATSPSYEPSFFNQETSLVSPALNANPVVYAGATLSIHVDLDVDHPGVGYSYPVTLTSSNPALLRVYPQTLQSSGNTAASVPWTAEPVSVDTPVTITANFGGAIESGPATDQVLYPSQKTITVTVKPFGIAGILLYVPDKPIPPASVKAGGVVVVSPYLNAPAHGSAATVVTLTSSNPAVLSIGYSTVSIPNGRYEPTTTLNAYAGSVQQDTPVTITATSGAMTRSVTLTVTP